MVSNFTDKEVARLIKIFNELDIDRGGTISKEELFELKVFRVLCTYHACMDVCMWVCMHVCVYACMYVCMHVCMHLCVCVCMCVCLYVCLHVCTCMHVCMYVCTCMYAYTLMCVWCGKRDAKENQATHDLSHPPAACMCVQANPFLSRIIHTAQDTKGASEEGV